MEANWVESKEEIKNHIREFFYRLYMEERTCRPKLDGLQFDRISEEQATWLEHLFDEEIKKVVWNMEGG